MSRPSPSKEVVKDLNWRPMFWFVPWAITCYALLSIVEPHVHGDFLQDVVAIGTLVVLFPVFLFGVARAMEIPDWLREWNQRKRG